MNSIPPLLQNSEAPRVDLNKSVTDRHQHQRRGARLSSLALFSFSSPCGVLSVHGWTRYFRGAARPPRRVALFTRGAPASPRLPAGGGCRRGCSPGGRAPGQFLARRLKRHADCAHASRLVLLPDHDNAVASRLVEVNRVSVVYSPVRKCPRPVVLLPREDWIHSRPKLVQVYTLQLSNVRKPPIRVASQSERIAIVDCILPVPGGTLTPLPHQACSGVRDCSIPVVHKSTCGSAGWGKRRVAQGGQLRRCSKEEVIEDCNRVADVHVAISVDVAGPCRTCCRKWWLSSSSRSGREAQAEDSEEGTSGRRD